MGSGGGRTSPSRIRRWAARRLVAAISTSSRCTCFRRSAALGGAGLLSETRSWTVRERLFLSSLLDGMDGTRCGSWMPGLSQGPIWEAGRASVEIPREEESDEQGDGNGKREG